MDIMVNDVAVGRLEFEIDLRLDLEGVLLKIRDGKIWEIKAGRCSGKGVCKCGKVTLMNVVHSLAPKSRAASSTCPSRRVFNRARTEATT